MFIHTVCDFQWLDSCIKVVFYSCLPGRESREGEKSTQLAGGHNIISGSKKLVRTRILGEGDFVL